MLAAAVAGAAGTDVDSHWYKRLDKPSWQPPGLVFGPVWSVLYASIAVASARALDRAPDARARRSLAIALATNLVLNAAWSWVFFRAHRPKAAFVVTALLEVSTVDLTRRVAALNRTAGVLLVPYSGWVAFASTLTGAIARRNP